MQTYHSFPNRIYTKKIDGNNRSALHKKIIRFVVLLIIMTICFTFGALMHASANNNEVEITRIQDELTIDVQKGDTLWSIARAYAPEGTGIRSFIKEIKRLNQLQSSTILEGDILILPQ